MAATKDYWTEVMADSPVAYWRLNELDGTSAADYTGNGRTGTIVGGVELGHVGALNPTGLGRSFDFDGTDGGVTVADHNDLDPDTSFAVEAWVRPDSVSGNAAIVRNGATGTGVGGFWLARITTGFRLYVADSVAAAITCTNSQIITIGNWYHIVGVIGQTANAITMWVNGVAGSAVDISSLGALTSGLDLGIGRYAAAATLPFDGRIAEVAIYQAALSSARIAAHYATGRQAPKAVTPARFGVARFGVTRFGDAGIHTARVYLAGSDRTSDVVASSLVVNDQANDTPTTASVLVENTAPTVGQSLWVVRNDTYHGRCFGGVVQQVQQVPQSGSGTAVQWMATATDGVHLLNRRRVTDIYGSQACDLIVKDIISTYTSGFTTQHVQQGLSSVDMTFTSETVSGALTRLANAVGGYWYLDAWYDLHFVVDEWMPLPSPVVEGGLHDPRDFRYSQDLSQVKTRVFVRGREFYFGQRWGGGSINTVYADCLNLGSYFAADDYVSIGNSMYPCEVIAVYTSPTSLLGNYLQIASSDAYYTQQDLGGYGAFQEIGFPFYVCSREQSTDGLAEVVALEGGDGIHDHYISDGRYLYDTCRARAVTELSLFDSPLERLEYTTTDPHAYAGRPVRVKLNAPWNVDTTLTIQAVTIGPWTQNPKALPVRRVVAASASEADFYTVLRRIQEQRGK